jgi:hypothetical protein
MLQYMSHVSAFRQIYQLYVVMKHSTVNYSIDARLDHKLKAPKHLLVRIANEPDRSPRLV